MIEQKDIYVYYDGEFRILPFRWLFSLPYRVKANFSFAKLKKEVYKDLEEDLVRAKAQIDMIKVKMDDVRRAQRPKGRIR